MSGGDAQKGKSIAIIGVSALLLVAMVVAVTVSYNKNGSENDIEDNRKHHVASTIKAVQTLCHPTDYKKECEESLIAEAGNTTDPKELIKIAFNVTIKKIGDKLKETELLHEVEKEPRAKMALDTCKQLMDLSIEEFKRSIDEICEFDLTNLDKILMNLKVWLSGAVTYQDTCLDGFENTTSEASAKMKELLTTGMHMSSNALAIVSDFADTVSDWNVTKLFGRRLLQDSETTPSWVDERTLLGTNTSTFKPNLTVAIDSSGDFKSINEALKHVPENNEEPFVIYIKEGIYQE
ncbi:Pectinesterase, catalytic [Sesbania bispinosa]|nr:Pectinesterase, catalytic [Sesbania bispinosa]